VKVAVIKLLGTDGSKFVCGVDLLVSNEDNCLVDSVRSANMIDFEISIKHYLVCETHTFDPTIDN
jgi:hypothetical protein